MSNVTCYGIADAHGYLWFDDFDTEKEAEDHAVFLNAKKSVFREDLKPFKVIPIFSKEQP